MNERTINVTLASGATATIRLSINGFGMARRWDLIAFTDPTSRGVPVHLIEAEITDLLRDIDWREE